MDLNRTFVPLCQEEQQKLLNALSRYQAEHTQMKEQIRLLIQDRDEIKVMYERAVALRKFDTEETAEPVSKIKSSLLANISHEIRTPMNAILGMGSLLGMTRLDSVQNAYVQSILKASRGLLAMINDILNLADMNESSSSPPDSDCTDCTGRLGNLQAVNTTALVVDDNEINLMVAEEILKLYHVQADLAKGGRQAIEMASHKGYDIIFMDHMMPDMDGIAATAQIRALDEWNSQVPIIALTANTVEGNRELFLQSSMTDYMCKPIDIDRLGHILNRWLPHEKKVTQTQTSNAPSMGRAAQPCELLLKLQAVCAIDIHSTLEMVGGCEDTYISILQTFSGTTQAKTSHLFHLLETADWERFLIEIHSEKSALYNIGARNLSEKAHKLEIACANNNFPYIHRHCPAFLEELQRLNHTLLELFPEKSIDTRKLASKEQMKALWRSTRYLIQLIDDLEHQSALKIIHQLVEYNYTKSIDNLLHQASSAMENFDYDSATMFLTQVFDMEETE